MTTKLGYMPGAFKPPHRGHFEAARAALKDVDQLNIIISETNRDQISGDVARQIWDVYAEALDPDRINLVVCKKTSPVRVVYETVEAINGSPYANEVDVFLYADKDDMGRYSRMAEYSSNLHDIVLRETARLQSARDFRKVINESTVKEWREFIPEEVDVDKVIDIIARI